MELSPETNLPWALRSLLSSPTTWEMRTLGPGTWRRIFTKGEGALQWHSRVTRGLSAPLKMGKIHSPQLLCRVCKTNIQERNVHPSLLPARSSISHIPGLVAPGQYWSSQPALQCLCRGSAVSGAPQTPRCCQCRKSLRKEHGDNEKNQWRNWWGAQHVTTTCPFC